MNLRRFQASNVNLTLEIFLLYHIRKYEQKLYLVSPGPLHVYSGAVKKGPLNYKRLLCTCAHYNLGINLYVNLGVSSLICKYL